MFYSYKNLPIKLNNNELLVNSAQVTIQANITPTYIVNQRNSFDYLPSDGIVGNLRINYYLTGKDFLKENINNENRIISGNIGGLHFLSGYLNSYNIVAEPNKVATVEANLIFFDKLQGQFSFTSTPPLKTEKTLNFSDVVVYHLTGYSIEPLTDVVSINYNFSSDIKPVYVINSGTGMDNISPYRIAFGPKEINTEIVADTLSGKLAMQGEKMGVKVVFTHPELTSLNESFTCSGVLYQRSISASVNQLVRTNLSIRQNFTEEPPTFTFTPTQGYPGEDVTLNGSNLIDTESVYFVDEKAKVFNVNSDSQISVRVPANAISGKIYTYSFGGIGESATDFKVLYPDITVNSFTPNTGHISGMIQISGSNFYRIDKVRFHNSNARFNRVNSSLVYAFVPEEVDWGTVRVVSELRNISGVSANKFVPIPLITGFSPKTGVSGTYVNIYGNYFSGITRGWFNNIEVTGLTVTSKSGIITYVPSGNINGYLSFSGQNNVYSFSSTKFNSEVKITGIYPSTGRSGDFVTIYGHNITSGYLYPEGNELYRVGFGDRLTGFGIFDYSPNDNLRITGRYALTGFIPPYMIQRSGFVYIYRPDGSVYDSTVRFHKIPDPPVITSYTPNFGLKTGELRMNINGRNLESITGVLFEGISLETTDGKSFSIPTGATGRQYLYEDYLGIKLNIDGYPLTGFQIGIGYYKMGVLSNYGTGYAPSIAAFEIISGLE